MTGSTVKVNSYHITQLNNALDRIAQAQIDQTV